MKNLISKYIDKITLSDINNFAIKNDINLSNDELTLIYNYIKNDWQTVLFGNNLNIFNDLKLKLSTNNYNKIINLYNYYKNIYL